MLERDYIMRLIREFTEALELLLKKDIRKQKTEIQKMYDQYVGPYSFYNTAAIEDVMESMEQFHPDERIHRMEMLAELYYAEAGMQSSPIRNMLLEKAYALFDFIDNHDKTYNINRLAKIAEIKKILWNSSK
ncbi:hypothetical protein [Xylanibacter muris]|uniref:Uncharacterized protein n=1 Tax=Xylanibacter muris TaxID=2736290 RepID=A0ABX2ARQ8_9BACT|nr:hypothetical protein [Xylanibacter muris]NPD93227.1 hypothetical protein [Xylanibacter muris]